VIGLTISSVTSHISNPAPLTFEDLAGASGVRLTRPLGYFEFLKLMTHSRKITLN